LPTIRQGIRSMFSIKEKFTQSFRLDRFLTKSILEKVVKNEQAKSAYYHCEYIWKRNKTEKRRSFN
jgi:hypothetical protein